MLQSFLGGLPAASGASVRRRGRRIWVKVILGICCVGRQRWDWSRSVGISSWACRIHKNGVGVASSRRALYRQRWAMRLRSGAVDEDMEKEGPWTSWLLLTLPVMTQLANLAPRRCFVIADLLWNSEIAGHRSSTAPFLVTRLTRAKRFAQRFELNMADEPETCGLCTSTGPPVKPSSVPTDAHDTATDLEWIACSNCDKWWHSVCVIKSPHHFELTIPSELRKQINSMGEDGPWFDWTDPVSKW